APDAVRPGLPDSAVSVVDRQGLRHRARPHPDLPVLAAPKEGLTRPRRGWAAAADGPGIGRLARAVLPHPPRARGPHARHPADDHVPAAPGRAWGPGHRDAR